MSDSRWSQLKALYDEARDLPVERRRGWLEQRCGDAELIDDALRLLEAPDQRTEGMPPLRVDDGESGSGSAWGPSGSNGLPLPRRIGRYTTVRVLGRGGMGVVYEAEQDVTHRRVALKEIREDVPSEEQLARFRREAEILGGLRHPGIAGVVEASIEVEAHQARPYIVMELVAGEPIDAWVAHRRVDLQARLRLLTLVCDAVGHAHRAGVVHRDLKPANILVEADGAPKVVDFGIARDLGGAPFSAAEATHSGQFLGTIHYTSPEQAAGQARSADARCDVYALGVVAFELCTGRRMAEFMSGAVHALREIAEGEPVRKALRTREVGALSSDLRTILGKALRLHPAERYDDAAMLTEDLRRLASGLPIAARPPSAGYRARKFAARHRQPLAVALLAIASVTVAVAAVAHLARQRRQEAHLRRRTEDAAAIQSADRALRDGRYVDCLNSLDSVEESARHWEWQWLRAQVDRSDWERRAVLPRILSCARWPDPPVVAVIGVDGDGSVAIVEPELGTRLATIAVDGEEVDAAALSEDGKRLIVALRREHGESLLAWSLESRELLGRIALPGRARGLACSSDGTAVVAIVPPADPADGAETGFVVTWTNVPDGQARLTSQSAPERVACTRDGRWAAVTSLHAEVALLDLKEDGLDPALSPSPTPIHGTLLSTSVAWGRRGEWLVVGRLGLGGEARGQVDRVHPGSTLPGRQLGEIGTRVCGVAVSPDDDWIVSAHAGGALRLFPGPEPGAPIVLSGHRADATHLCFNASGERLVSVDLSGAVRGWTIPPRPLTFEVSADAGFGGPSRLACAAVAVDTGEIVSAHSAASLRPWRVTHSRVSHRVRVDYAGGPAWMSDSLLDLATAPVAITCSSDGARIAVAARDGTVSVLRFLEHQLLSSAVLPITSVGRGLQSLAMDPAGELVATIAPGMGVDVCRADAGIVSSSFRGPGRTPVALAFVGARSTQPLLAVATAELEVLLLDPRSGTVQRSARVDERVTALDSTPGTSVLVAGTAAGGLSAWDVRVDRAPRPLGVLPARVDAVEVSRDGRRVVAACEDGTIHVVDVSTGLRLITLDWNGTPPSALAFVRGLAPSESPADDTLLAISGAVRAYRWRR